MGNRVEEVQAVPVEEIVTGTGDEIEPDGEVKEEVEKINGDECEKINDPLNFSGSPLGPEVSSSSKMQYEGRDKGRQRKFYETIALLEMYHAKDTRLWIKLDEQMQRYYKREYPEYFDRDSKSKREQRQVNKVKAARIRHERLQRDIKGSSSKNSGERTEPVDFQAWRDKVSG